MHFGHLLSLRDKGVFILIPRHHLL